jgi:CRISPR-associated protein (Cas_Csm6)
MASIILSFVGTQDPYSERTKEEGSIVSLAKHLLEKSQEIKHILLLYTQDLEPRATLTQEWLKEELKLTSEIELIAVSEILSDDPIDILRATTAAKQALESAQRLATKGDYLEMNFSSGTPTMKSTWTILQAAGYAPNGRVWQVRNPAEMREGQNRVFNADLTVLKNEFDLKIIKQQLDEYNYSGALATITASRLDTPEIEALLKYGHSRLSFDFDRANNAIRSIPVDRYPELVTDIAQLRQKDKLSLLKEVYFIADISIKNQEYCDFLIAVSQFQENFLKLCLANQGLPVPDRPSRMNEFWDSLKGIESGSIYRELEQIKLNRNEKAIVVSGNTNIPTQIAILKLMGLDSSLSDNLERLKEYCDDRNAFIHRLEGVSQIDNADLVLNKIKSIMKQQTKIPDRNPYDRLNEIVLAQLASDD